MAWWLPLISLPVDGRDSNAGVNLAQCRETGRVLSCSGNDSYVQLPDNLFDGLEEATIEVWVKWEGYGASQRPWDFGGTGQHTYLTPGSAPGWLLFRIDGEGEAKPRIEVAGIPRLQEWTHGKSMTTADFIPPLPTFTSS